MSWESTAVYYRLLNEGVRARRGGLTSAPLLIWSPDFAPIAESQEAARWEALAEALGGAGRGLVGAGAGALLICTNTMHRLHEEVERAAGVPVLHIADATGAALVAAGLRRPILLGTRFTMEAPFYADRLRERFDLEPRTPAAADRDLIHAVIYDELCRGLVREESRRECRRVIAAMEAEGADSLILGKRCSGPTYRRLAA